MEFRLAQIEEVGAVRAFFARNLPRGGDAVYTEEFYCPLGIKAAIQRKQLLVGIESRQIAAAVRFYPKKNGEISLYQFAVEPAFRGMRLSRNMFDHLRQGRSMISLCPQTSEFNHYYERTGWQQDGLQGTLKRWVLREIRRVE